MNINTVVDNLRKTIAGKEAYMQGLRDTLVGEDTDGIDRIVLRTTIKFLEINVQELKVILYDVEQCAEQFSLMSWEINPERMGQ